MTPDTQAFFDERTFTVTYLVSDPQSRLAVIIDPVLDYDPKSARTSTGSADAVLAAAKARHLNVEWILETHAHADHLHGIDDLRIYFALQQNRIPIYADPITMARIKDGFAYCLETPPGSSYPPIVEPRIIADIDAALVIDGAGGPIPFNVHMQQHGDVHSLGFRIGDVAYCTDVSDFPAESLPKLAGLDVLVIDALQHRYHPSHLSLEQALGWIERFAPKRAILTHMHIPLDYETVMRETPDHVEPAYDQMRFEIEIEAA